MERESYMLGQRKAQEVAGEQDLRSVVSFPLGLHLPGITSSPQKSYLAQEQDLPTPFRLARGV